MCKSVLLACISMNYVHVWYCRGQKRASDVMGLVLRRVVFFSNLRSHVIKDDPELAM